MLRDNELARDVTNEAIELLPGLFGAPDSAGVTMAVRAAGAAEPPAVLGESLVALIGDLQSDLQRYR